MDFSGSFHSFATDIPPQGTCPREGCVRAAPALPCAGQRAPWADNPRRSALGAAKCEAERQPPPAKRRFRRRKDTGPTPPRLSDPQQLARGPARRTEEIPPAMASVCTLWEGSGCHRGLRPKNSPPPPPKPEFRPPGRTHASGEHTPAGQAAPASRAGRNRSGAAGETYGGRDRRQRTTSWVLSPRSPGGRRQGGRLSPGERRRLPGRKERAWGARPGEDSASRLPRRELRSRPAERLPESDSGR